VEVVNMQEDLDDTKASLTEDQQFFADLNKNCATAEEDYAVVKKTRADELLALAETIKILNDDDALDLFKKTLPTPSLLQTRVTTMEMRNKALKLLHDVKSRNPHLDMIMLALRSKKVSFDKVLKLIDEMVSLLQTEQKDDDDKKSYCESEIDKTEDEYKGLVQENADLTKAIKDGNGMLETLAEEIAATTKGIQDLDAQVSAATTTRQEENAEWKQTMAADNAAKELLKKAKNRMNQFYNPRLATAAAASFVQFTMRTHRKDAPPPPPEAVGAYQKKGEESNAVLVMMDALVADLDKEIQELTTEENDAQKEYEQFIQDSANKRAADSKSLSEKEGAKADLEIEMEKASQEKKAKLAEEMAKAEYLSDVHRECDWLLQNYLVRKDARDGEIESLKNAKAVLSGADYSF
jgi:septal ring factor EnvC (AmiA/AmiB activator)